MFIESAPTSLLSALAKPAQTRSIAPSSSQLTLLDPDLVTLLNQSRTTDKFHVQKSLTNSRHHDLKLIQPNSTSTLISNDSKSVCFHAKCLSCFETEAVRTDKPINSNCITQIEWHVGANTTGGTSVMFGVCREQARLHCAHGYVNLLGKDELSWALSSKGLLHHNGRAIKYCDAFDDGREHTVRCIVNSITGEIFFAIDGKYKGKAFDSIRLDAKLYACVASTVTRSIFRLEHVVETNPSLQELCSFRIKEDSRCVRQAFDEYRLPRSMIFGSYS